MTMHSNWHQDIHWLVKDWKELEDKLYSKIIWGCLLLLALHPKSGTAQTNTESAPVYDPFVLVELFSSEGCNSCPNADVMMRELSTFAQSNQLRIFVLDFHVELWDEYGWKDPYAEPEYTMRQELYAKQFGRTSLATPQVVFNGSQIIEGFNRKTLNDYIIPLTQQPASIQINAQGALLPDENKVKITYQIDGTLPDSCIITAALFESNLTSKVTGGDNVGKELHHSNTVRAYEQLPDGPSKGYFKLKLPKGAIHKNLGIVVFAQHPTNLKVVGATQLLFE